MTVASESCIREGHLFISSSSERLQSRTETITLCPGQIEVPSVPDISLGETQLTVQASSGDGAVCLGSPAETAEMEVLNEEEKHSEHEHNPYQLCHLDA